MNYTMPFNKATRMRALTIGVLALGILSVQVGRGTLAYFTTQVTSGANTFTAGNLHFNISDNAVTGDTTTAATSSIALSNMKPGDSVFAPITVSNIGSLDGQYGIAYTAANSGGTDLTTHLTIGVVGAGSGSGPSAANCTGTNFATSAMWAEQILPVAVAMSAASTIVDSTSVVKPLADGAYVAADVSAGAHLPLLHTGAANFSSDLLCVQVTFPDGGTPGSITTGDNTLNAATAQSWNTTVVFTFNGQQRNHPTELDQPTGPTTGNF